MGWDWIVIAIVALLAAFTETKLRKILVLFCGVAVLVETALTLAFIGVFLGNEMIGSAPVLLMVGGLLSDTASKPQDAEKLAQLRIKACKKKWWEEHRLAKEAALGKPCDQCAGIVDTREMAGNLGALGEITQKKCPRPNFRISLILARFFKICGTEPSFTLYSRRGHHLRRRFYP